MTEEKHASFKHVTSSHMNLNLTKLLRYENEQRRYKQVETFRLLNHYLSILGLAEFTNKGLHVPMTQG
jgi:hypothetical protein